MLPSYDSVLLPDLIASRTNNAMWILKDNKNYPLLSFLLLYIFMIAKDATRLHTFMLMDYNVLVAAEQQKPQASL